MSPRRGLDLVCNADCPALRGSTSPVTESQDDDAAYAVWSSDDEVDTLHERVFADILTCMTAGADPVGVCTHLLFIAKDLERIGDHATNIAEMVHYQVTGQDLRDRPKR